MRKTTESVREAKDQIMKQVIKYNKYARHGGRRYRQTLNGSEEGNIEGCMKHAPNGREESQTARDWDPRTHEQTARDWDPRTQEQTARDWDPRTHEQTAREWDPRTHEKRAQPTAGGQRLRSRY